MIKSYLMRRGAIVILFTMGLSIFISDNVFAMHISEGILPWNWAAFWLILALPFVSLGLMRLKKLSKEDLSIKPLVGLMAAGVFIISCMPVPVPTAGTCSHPCGTGISAILVGPLISILITAVALLIQALFLAHGGLSTWGADIVSMGIVGSFAGYLTFKCLRAIKINIAAAAFMAGLFADWATYLTTSVELASGIKGNSSFLPIFSKILIAFIPTQLPLGILEGAMTAGVVLLLYKRRPDLLVKMRVLRLSVFLIIAAVSFISCSAIAAPAAHKEWIGVDESVVEKYAQEHGRGARTPLINTDQGDLLLFVFLLAGAAGGFLAGYCWRMLVKEKGIRKEGRGEPLL